MKLITKKIEKLFEKYPLYSQENAGAATKAICKFFCGGFTWYVTEAEKRDNDWLFFGLVDGFDKELGYFTLSQLKSVRTSFGLGVERDMYFKPTLLSEIEKKLAY